jgi:hypothetical protein
VADAGDRFDYSGIIKVELNRNAIGEAEYQRLRFAYSYYDGALSTMADWVRSSRETSNFTYDITRGCQNRDPGAIPVGPPDAS